MSSIPSPSDLLPALLALPRASSYIFDPARAQSITYLLHLTLLGPYTSLYLPTLPSMPPSAPSLSDLQRPRRRAGMPCGHVFARGEPVWRCRDCALDDSCVFCARCFHATHPQDDPAHPFAGHQVALTLESPGGGCCDCGDPEAWRIDPGRPPHLDDEAQEQEPFPAEAEERARATIAEALDFILDVLENSPVELQPPMTVAQVRGQPSMRDGVAGEEGEEGPWSVVLWNDEKHSFDEVISQVCEATGCSAVHARAVAERIDGFGREVLQTSSDIPALLRTAIIIAHIELAVTLRPAYDTFLEQAAHVVLAFLLDLCRVRPAALRRVLAEELLSPRRDEASNTTRLDALFVLESRMWKKARGIVKEMLISLLAEGQDVKLEIGARFASVYQRIVESFLMYDHEPELSIIMFSVQLFTVPSVAHYLCTAPRSSSPSLLTHLVEILESFLTDQRLSARELLVPPDFNRSIIDVDAAPFRHKRYFSVFGDLRTLLSTAHVKRALPARQDIIPHLVRFLALFMGMNAARRAAVQHVEYESDSWINAFNCSLQLGRLARLIGQAFEHATPAQLRATVEHVLYEIGSALRALPGALPGYEDVAFGGNRFVVVRFSVAAEDVSFHHPLHWLLAETLKHSNLLADGALAQTGVADLAELFARAPKNEVATVALFDQPLRVCAMLAQIRTGLWVRNGLAIRGQLHHYRDVQCREYTHDQDLFVVQALLSLVDADLALVSILHRFDLVRWFEGLSYHVVYDAAQAAAMAEEVLLLLVTCLSERANVERWSPEKIIRREIVHALCLGPSTFSDLVKRMPESIVDDAMYERVLAQVAKFKAPDGTYDLGMFELRDECFDEVDPFFFHYSRNSRETAEEAVKASRRRRAAGQKEQEGPVCVPRRLEVEPDSPFAALPRVFRSEVLHQIIYTALAFALDERTPTGEPAPTLTHDALIDASLHLVMLGLVEQPEVFPHLAARKAFHGDDTLVQLLCRAEADDRLKNVRPKVACALDRMAQHVAPEVRAHRRVEEAQPKAANAAASAEAKRAAAKARQAAIMQKFASAQKNLLDQFEDENEDEDMDEEGGTPADAIEPERSFGDCIVCQEALNQSEPFGSLAFIQPSRFVRHTPPNNAEFAHEPFYMPRDLDRPVPDTPDPMPSHLRQHINRLRQQPKGGRASPAVPNPSTPGFPPEHNKLGLHASACGHLMHLRCFETYYASIVSRHQQQVARNHPENTDRKEFVCPLCKSLGNVVLPIFKRPQHVAFNTKITEWVRTASIDLLKDVNSAQLNDFQEREAGSGEFLPWYAESPAAGSPPARGRPSSDPTRYMVDRLLDVVRPMSAQSADIRRHAKPASQPLPPEGMYLPAELVGYTVAALEIAQRGQGAPGKLVSDSVSDTSFLLLESLLGTLDHLATRHEVHRARGPGIITKGIYKRILPEWGREDSVRQPLLLRDPLSVLVETAAVAPEALRPMVTLTFYAALVRAVVGIVQAVRSEGGAEQLMLKPPSDLELPPADVLALFDNFAPVVRFVMQSFPALHSDAELLLRALSPAQLAKMLYSYTLPFLRRAAILDRVVRGGAALSGARPWDGGAVDEHEPCEYVRLIQHLQVMPPSEALDPTTERQTTIQRMVEGWCLHLGHHVQELRPRDYPLRLEHPAPYRLIRLPRSLGQLIEDCTTRPCTRCGKVPTEPALCLLCGTSVCHQSFCCQDPASKRGECNTHMLRCGGSIGIFFLVKKAAVVYLYANKGTFAQGPYLDLHGEIDIGLRRGRPQFLHPQRYEEIRKQWLSHGIPTFVARRLEATIDQGGWVSF